tara:strand:- start:222 stop:1106 length:885 start_codon:yes stop_codon:yes gene_type:complete
MSGGGGSSSDGGNEQAAAKAAMTTQAAYTSSASPATTAKVDTGGRDESAQQAALQTYHQNLEDYDEPDAKHFNQTQKDIKSVNKDLKKSGQYDVKMSDDEYKKFNADLNKYYGTENVKYEPYGRAGQGTVNLSFKEHYDNLGHQYKALRFSPVLRFLAAAGKNIDEYLTTDYGTYKYGGPGRDSGGLLGSFGSGGSTFTPTASDRDVMNNLAPEAPYIVSGTQQPTDSPAANWYQSLGNTNTSNFKFSFENELNAARSKQKAILNTSSGVGQLAVNQSPFYNWLKTKSLNKGIL